MKVRFYDIQWNTDGADVTLPSVVTLDTDYEDSEEVALQGADLLSDKFGFCVNSFEFAVIAESMTVESILAIANKCNTYDDSDCLLDLLLHAFSSANPVAHLPMYNSEAYLEASMEDNQVRQQPFVRFELNKKISEYYVTMIRPEIREGKFVIEVVTNHMKDGLGMSSQSWDLVEDMEEVIEGESDDTILAMAEKAKELAIKHHAQLLERVGVASAVAFSLAESSW